MRQSPFSVPITGSFFSSGAILMQIVLPPARNLLR
jgi:hypothetical protein